MEKVRRADKRRASWQRAGLAADGRPYRVYLVAGLVVNVAAVRLLLSRFDRVVHC